METLSDAVQLTYFEFYEVWYDYTMKEITLTQ